MPSFSTEKLVPYTPGQMFALVADIERYPEFLPLCEGLTVRSRETRGDQTLLVADMSVGHRRIRERFTSRVTLRPSDHQIDVSYVDGPFRHMHNTWTFREGAAGQTCRVQFHIDYEFKSMMLGLLMGALFDTAFRKFTAAFEERARQIYVRPSVGPGGKGAFKPA
jgi:coenzyme Q-binding protein COQ10